MTTTASTSQQSVPLSRLARLGVNLGLKHLSHAGPSRVPRQYTDANETEWYIPYNGPYEQPKAAVMGGVSDKGGWSEFVANSERAHNHSERNPSVLGYGGASSSGHGHELGRTYSSSAHGNTYDSFYDEERGRGLQLSPLSRYSESLATFGGGERRSHVVASPTTSPISTRRGALPAFYGPDATGSGIGEVPVPLQRFGQSSNSGHGHDLHEYAFPHGPSSSTLAPAPIVSPRESVASFWTFGRSASKKAPPINASGGPPSFESRQSTSTPQTVLQPIVIRDRSATVSSQRGDPFKGQPMRPRAYTSAPSAPSALPPALLLPESRGQHTDDRPEPDRATSPYQRHPYATAVSPTGHRQHSQLMRPPQQKHDPQERRSPALNLNVPLLSSKKSFTSLRRAANHLKTSVSTPNLRGEKQRGTQRSGGSSTGSPGTPSAGSAGAKWLSAETWCDALLFPRPRFRLRSAHVISPPTSPIAGNPPYSAPAQTQDQPRTLKKSFFGARSPVDPRRAPQAPSSAPPIVLHSNPEPPPAPPAPLSVPAPARAVPGPSQQSLRPPRPKSFAQDDLALPSPVPSLSTVLRQNEEFEKEREIWKTKASRSFGNKRSRSLSRSRLKAKAMLTGQPEESDAELALSFDFLAARAFHGSQVLKPSIHFAPTPPASTARSGAGTNTTSTGLNTMSTHSRNTSNVSRGGSATSRSNHGHARKESWGKSALKTAKSTANATGLCTFNDDLSPADEKVMALDVRLKQDRIKQPHANGENDVSDDNVLVISAQNSSYLSPHQQKTAGPSLSPVPSDISGESIARTGVGIALSTPTAHIDHSFQFVDHPYATRQNESVPRSAEYAGPHPSHISRMTDSVVNEPSLADISARHRRPAAPLRSYVDTTSLHPYAAVERRARPSLRVGSIPAPSKMFADVGTGSIREVLPDDIQYSPYSAQYSAKSSKHNSDALGVEEALSLAFSHGEMDGSDPGQRVEQQRDESADFGAQGGSQELIAPPVLRSALRGRDLQIDESGHESWQTSQDDDNNGNLMAPTPMSMSSYKQNSSPGQVSYESSPMTSPRQFKKFDDMEDYSDLFYRPGQQSMVAGTPGANNGNSSGSSGQPSPPSEVVLTRSRDGDTGSQRPMLTRSNSALTRLRLQLSEEYEANNDDRHILGAETALKRHVSEVIEVDEDLDDMHAVVSQGSSPPGATLPLRVQMNRPESAGPGNLIPEDVESSRASSVLERYETEEGTEIYYRLGEVPALATPDPITSTNTHRASAHVSYIGNTPPSNHRSLTPDEQRQHERRSRPSLLPPMSATTSTTRGSYMTSTSSTSHISQLSDFPVPPGQPSLTPGSIIQSYFGNSPEPPSHADPRPRSSSPERGREVRRSRRTTFGPVPEDSP